MGCPVEDDRETPPRAYRDRQPRLAMEAPDLVEVLDLIDRSGVTVWLDGGWGVDALLGKQMREHDDVDLIAERRRAQPRGYAHRAWL